MQTPVPDPALERLQKLVGTWDIKGRTLDSKEDNITGRMTCEWLPGGFFLKQSGEITLGALRVQCLEIIAYDSLTQTFPSTVYGSMSGVALQYHWNVQGNNVTHWTDEDRYTGTFSEDGNTLSGGWRPVEGKEGLAYDATMTRVDSGPGRN